MNLTLKILTTLTTFLIIIDFINNRTIIRCLKLREQYNCEINRLTYTYFEINFYAIIALSTLTGIVYYFNQLKLTNPKNKFAIAFYLLFIFSYFNQHMLLNNIL